MKKLILFLLAILSIAVVSTLFSSCEDPAGVYKPKKRISKVYRQSAGQAEYLREEWIWNGNKVTSIIYYNGLEFDAMDVYSYEGDRLFKVRANTGDYFECHYIDKQFDRIKYYTPAGVLEAEIICQYDDEKLSTFTIYPYKANKNLISMIERGFVGKILTEEGMKMVSAKLSNHSKAPLVCNLFYEGENLSSIGYDDDLPILLSFSDYDSHSNVWYNFFPFTNSLWNFNYKVFSKNNPQKISVLDHTSIYTYTYDADYPVTIQEYKASKGDTLIRTTRIEYY